jgi:hypothetical protein
MGTSVDDLDLASATLTTSTANQPERAPIAAPAKFVSLKTFLQIWPVLLAVVITGLTLAAQH